MKSVETFLVIYAIFLFSTVIVLSLLGIDVLDLYVALFAVEFFATSELSPPLGPAEAQRKNAFGIALLIVFAGIVLQRVMQLLV